MATENLANEFTTTLFSTISAGVTALTLTSDTGSGLRPAPSAPFRIRMDNEIILVTVRSGTNCSTIARGQEGTTAASHTGGAVIKHVLTVAGLLDQVQGSTVAGSTTQMQYNNAGAFGGLSNGTAGQLLTSNGAGVVPSFQSAPVVVPGTLLAYTKYQPGADGTLGTTASATLVDMDAVNAFVTFTAPASGNVLVQFHVLGEESGIERVQYGIRESTTILSQVWMFSGDPAIAVYRTATCILTGLSAGTHTYTAAHGVPSGGSTTSSVGPTYGAFLMYVWSLP